jgi:O-antigen/teichoic acid export membrane protein
LGHKWEGRVLAQVFVSVIFGIISIYIIFKNWIFFEVKGDYIIQLLKFGIPLIFFSISYLLMFHINRFIVAKFLSLEDLGILNVSIQLGGFIDLIASSFNIAFLPWIYKKFI